MPVSKALLTIGTLFVVSGVCAQITQVEQVFGEGLPDSVTLSVILPAGWTDTQDYPVIYHFEMLSMTGGSLSRQLAGKCQFYNEFLGMIPPVIVVAIDLKNIENLGYSYHTGAVNDSGQKLIETLEKQIFSLLEGKYRASPKFRIYFGHSLLASYGNYLFLHRPGLFTSYIMATPEQLGPSNPPFAVDQAFLAAHRNRKFTIYFLNLAYSKKDIEALHYFAAYFLTDTSDALEYFNLGNRFNSLGAKEDALIFLRKSIEKANMDEVRSPSPQNPETVFMAYRTIALNVYNDQPERAVEALQEGWRETGDLRFRYFLGKVGIEHAVQLESSVNFLREYIRGDHPYNLWGYVRDEAYFLLGTGYLQLNQKEKAKAVFQEALEINPQNQRVRETLKSNF